MLDEIWHWNPRLQGQPNLGEDGRASGAWWRSGQQIQGYCLFEFAGAGVSGGGPSLFLYVYPPVLPDLSLIQGSNLGSYGHKIGSGRVRDDSNPGNSVTCSVEFLPFPRNGMSLQFDQSSDHIDNTSPFTWAAGDAISFNFSYPADARLLA